MSIEAQFFLLVVIVTVVRASNNSIQGIVNETISMPCDISGSNGSLVYWYSASMDKYLSSQRVIVRVLAPELYSRLSVRGIDTRYDFEISPLKFSDSGIYRCQIYTVINETSQRFIKTIDYELVVHAAPLPQYPECSVRGSGVINDVVSLSCISHGGVPPVHLDWYRGGELLTGVRDIVLNTLTYNKTLAVEDNGVNYTCKASSPVFTGPRECVVTLLKEPPTVFLTQSRGRVFENDEVTYWCSGFGMPSVSYRWLTGDTVISENSARFALYDGGRELHLRSAAMADNRTMVTCQVSTPSGLMSSEGMMLLVSKKEEACNNSTVLVEVQSKMPVIAILVAFVGGIGITLLLMIVIRALCKRRRRRRDLRAKRAEEMWTSKHEYSTAAEPTPGQDIFTKDNAFVTSSNGLQPPLNPPSVQNIQAQKNQYFEMHSGPGAFRESSATFPKSGPRNDYQMRSTAPSPPILPLENGVFSYENVGRGSGTDLTDISHSEVSAPSGVGRSPIYMEPKMPSRPKPHSPNRDARSQSLQRVTYDAVPRGMRRDAELKKGQKKGTGEQPEYTEIDCMAYIPIRNTYEASIISNFEL